MNRLRNVTQHVPTPRILPVGLTSRQREAIYLLLLVALLLGYGLGFASGTYSVWSAIGII